MNATQLQDFKDLLSVPSKTYKEEGMVKYITSVLDNIEGVSYYLDHKMNVYATKGKLPEGKYYPMFIAHTDTVHELQDKIVVKEEYLRKPNTFGKSYDDTEYLSLKGYLEDGTPTGIGGDDKVGIFIAIELLKTLNYCKVGLFVSEETGCIGSSQCDLSFLEDVGYAIQFDCPGDHLITEYCSGVQLYQKNGEFINKILPIFSKAMGCDIDQQSHPYTDVSQIKLKCDFSCINFSCGYYNMHTSKEFVVVQDVENAFNSALNMVNELGFELYEFLGPNDTYENDYDDDDLYTFNSTIWDNIEMEYTNDEFTIEDHRTDNFISLDYEQTVELYLFLKEQLNDKY